MEWQYSILLCMWLVLIIIQAPNSTKSFAIPAVSWTWTGMLFPFFSIFDLSGCRWEGWHFCWDYCCCRQDRRCRWNGYLGCLAVSLYLFSFENYSVIILRWVLITTLILWCFFFFFFPVFFNVTHITVLTIMHFTLQDTLSKLVWNPPSPTSLRSPPLLWPTLPASLPTPPRPLTPRSSTWAQGVSSAIGQACFAPPPPSAPSIWVSSRHKNNETSPIRVTVRLLCTASTPPASTHRSPSLLPTSSPPRVWRRLPMPSLLVGGGAPHGRIAKSSGIRIRYNQIVHIVSTHKNLTSFPHRSQRWDCQGRICDLSLLHPQRRSERHGPLRCPQDPHF